MKPQTIDKYAARLLMIAYFLPMGVQAAVIIVLCVYLSFRVFIGRMPVNKQFLLWALLLSSGFFLFLGAIPLTPAADRHILLDQVSNRLSSLLIPVVFAIITPSFGSLLMRELRFFVYACIAAMVVANGAFIYHTWFSGLAPQPLSHVAYRQFLEGFTGIHPTYWGMYLGFAICILLQGYVTLSKAVKFALLYLLIVFLLAILAKSPLIAMVIILAHYSWRHRSSILRYKMLLGGLLVAVIAAAVFIPFIGQRLGEMLALFGKAKPTSVIDNSIYVRQLIWQIDTGLIRQHWLTGIGPAHLTRYLDYHYFFYSVSHGQSIGYYDPHNEYFWQWISFGVMGIITCVAVLAVHVIRAIKTKNFLYLYLMLILVITFSTESVLSRQQGILFYTVFTSLFFFYKPVSHLQSEQQ